MLREIDERVDALREQLRERYGWTHLELRTSLDAATLRVTGTIAVSSLAFRLRELLCSCLGPGVNLELELGPMPVLSWHRVDEEGIELWAEHPSCERRSLATQLGASDGPIGLLAEAPPGTLVRARDGTVGWLLGELGPREPARLLTEPSLPEQPGPAICEAAKAYLGVPYLLGGASSKRIDCSGLVARAYAAALGVVLPRNSNDQLAVAGGGEASTRAEGSAGDLLFIRSRALGRTHVGVATGRATVIHASRTRGSVLEEGREEFERDAEWIRRVRWQAVVTWSRTQVGRPQVDLPSATPGSPTRRTTHAHTEKTPFANGPASTAGRSSQINPG